MGTYFKVLGNPAFGTTDVPPGLLVYSPVNSIGGYLLCDGSAVSRTTYADLFNLISTTYGSGDGSTTFNLPDFTNTTLKGADATTDTLGTTTGANSITIDESSYGAHTHSISISNHTHNLQSIKHKDFNTEYFMFNDDLNNSADGTNSATMSSSIHNEAVKVHRQYPNTTPINSCFAGSIHSAYSGTDRRDAGSVGNTLHLYSTANQDYGSIEIGLDSNTSGNDTSWTHDTIPPFVNLYVHVKF